MNNFLKNDRETHCLVVCSIPPDLLDAKNRFKEGWNPDMTPRMEAYPYEILRVCPLGGGVTVRIIETGEIMQLREDQL